MRSCVGALIACLGCGSATAEPLGRLFFTPQERAALDFVRSERDRIAHMAGAPDATKSSRLSYTGVVQASDGASTVWLNHRPVDGRQAFGPTGRVVQLHADGALTVRLPRRSQAVTLKVGQALEPHSGQVVEDYTRHAPQPDGKPATTRPRKPESAFRLRRRLADDDPTDPLSARE